MKSKSSILRHCRSLRAICDDPTAHDTDQRVAQAMESALCWAIYDGHRFNLADDAKLIAQFLRDDLKRKPRKPPF